MKMLAATAVTTIAVLSSIAAFAQSEGSKELQRINNEMHSSMQMEMTGDVDADFMRAMIPHHQSAVDMAKVVLAYGKDPETRRLAEDIVRSQEAEIKLMNDWLSKHGASAPEKPTGGHSTHGG